MSDREQVRTQHEGSVRSPRMVRRWLSLILLAATLALASVSFSREAAAHASPLDAIGRLFFDGGGPCTAFVVRSTERLTPRKIGGLPQVFEHWLVTAGHCIGQKMIFRLAETAYPIGGLIGFSAGTPYGHDVMVLAFYTARPVPALEPAFGHYPKSGERLLLIGYARDTLMMRIGPVIGYDERGHIVVDSYAIPGNSGGPVLIPGTRRVVGIVIEVTLEPREGNPAQLCAYPLCDAKPPYYAAHIDRLLGIANFRSSGDQP